MSVDIQQYYRAAGFATFPLNGKIPIIKEWQKLTLDTCPACHDGNYGVLLPTDVLVVDADPRNYRVLENGVKDDPLARLSIALGGFPQTLTVLTGGGGIHKYFRIPPMPVVKSHPLYTGLDFLSHGRFVVGAGSIHPTTRKPYTFDEDSPKVLATAPTELVALLASRGATPLDLGGDSFPNLQASVRKYKEMLKTLEPANTGQQGDLQTFKAAVLGHDLGLLPDVTLECLLEVYNPRCSPPWDDEELLAKVDNAYRYARKAAGNLVANPPFTDNDQATFELVRQVDHAFNPLASLTLKSTGGVDGGVSNAVYFLTTPVDTPLFTNQVNRLFKYNVLSEEVELAYQPPWESHLQTRSRISTPYTDADITALKLHFRRETGAKFSTEELHEAVRYSGRLAPYNPVLKYLRGLKWDGVPRLQTWLHDYCGAEDTAFNEKVGEVMFLAAVARAFEPGCKWQYLPILEGAQGARKSEFVKLMAKSPKHYASISLNLKNGGEKETYIALRGKWVIEISELSGHGGNDVDSLKKFLSDDEGRIRNPYDRTASDVQKPCILIGTYNPSAEGYLRDLTGNRRYLPVYVKCMPEGDAAETLIDHLYAEAVALYHQGCYKEYPWDLLESLGKEKTQSITAQDPWCETVNNWILSHDEAYTFTAHEVATECLRFDLVAINDRLIGRIRRVLQYLQVPHKIRNFNGVVTKVYYRGGDGYLGELGAAFQAIEPLLAYGQTPLSTFLAMMGVDNTPKNSQQVGMWLRGKGHETKRAVVNGKRVTVVVKKGSRA